MANQVNSSEAPPTRDGVEFDAIVVGSGPNGLAAAVQLARYGLSVHVIEGADEIGGGTRTREYSTPGVLHDVCSAVHPMGVASPFLQALDLERHGLVWRWPEIQLAHPLTDGTAGALRRDLIETALSLGEDSESWRRLFAPLVERFDELLSDVLRPVLHVPLHPSSLIRFGLGAVQPATVLASRWETDRARALFGGVAAHAFYPLSRPGTAAIGLMLGAAGHAYGWPVAEGGSRAITDALAAALRSFGGTIETGRWVSDLRELPSSRVVLLDTSPRAAVEIAGERIPGRLQQRLRQYRHGPGAFKVDLEVEGGVPWTAEECRRAGTVHVGGTFEEIAASELAVHRRRMPERPFILVGQQYLADPTRSAGDVHPVWAYAHVPQGFDGDATGHVIDRIEEFAPGLRERIVATHVAGPGEIEQYNPNYIGGDIATGANDLWQIVARPALSPDPYRLGDQGVFLCSAATPPGAGVHGMCGANAAVSALKFLGIKLGGRANRSGSPRSIAGMPG